MWPFPGTKIGPDLHRREPCRSGADEPGSRGHRSGQQLKAKPGLQEKYSPLITQATKSNVKTLATDHQQTPDLTLKLEPEADPMKPRLMRLVVVMTCHVAIPFALESPGSMHLRLSPATIARLSGPSWP